MPQLLTTTTTPLGYVIATMQAAINTLITNMQAGKAINAADIAAMNSSMYNLWRTHTHTAADRTGIDVYGNLTVYGAGGTSTTATASAPAGLPAVTTPVGIVAGGQITAANINTMINMVNSIRAHAHTITDSVGATAAVVSISTATYTFTVVSEPVFQSLTFATNGELQTDGAGPLPGQWLDMSPTDTATAGQYEVNVTLVGGNVTPTGSALGTWLAVTTDRHWDIFAPIGTTKTADLLCQVRKIGTVPILDTATITIVANSLP